MVRASALHSVDLDSIPLSSCSQDLENTIQIRVLSLSKRSNVGGEF